MAQKLDIKRGEKYNKWTVLSEAERRNGRRAFNCVCKCGKERAVTMSSLRGGISKSCGSCYIYDCKITDNILKELFHYRDDGELVRKVTVNNIGVKGKVAGSVTRNGYKAISVSGVPYLAHRLVWLWHNGYMPEGDIDHINRNKLDNRIENLREVTKTCNLRNTGNRESNTSGVKGVYFFNRWKKWVARIGINSKTIHIGASSDFAEAVCLRLAAEQCLDWGSCDNKSPAFMFVNEGC